MHNHSLLARPQPTHQQLVVSLTGGCRPGGTETLERVPKRCHAFETTLLVQAPGVSSAHLYTNGRPSTTTAGDEGALPAQLNVMQI
jgi:hypothetical protein